MSAAPVLQWVAVSTVGALALWRLVLLLTSRHRTRARVAVVLLLSSAALANGIGLDPVNERVDALVPGLAGLASNLGLLGFYLGFLVLFGSTVASPLGRVRPQVVVVGVAAVLMTGAWFLTWRAGATLEYRALGPESPAGPLAFFAVGHLYFGYACLVAAHLAARAMSTASAVGRVAFGACAAGMLLAFLGGPAIRFPTLVGIVAGWGPVPEPIRRVGLLVLTVGIALVALGLCATALASSVARFRRWREAKRGIAVLDPLWRGLAERFEGLTLYHVRGAWVERLRLRDVPLHYHRRLVETRDGLWRLSPYIEDDDLEAGDAMTSRRRAELVREGLRRMDRGDPLVGVAVSLAGGPDDDEAALLALARDVALVRDVERRPPTPVGG